MNLDLKSWNANKKINILFAVVSILFGIAFFLTKVSNDDIALYTRVGENLADYWNYSVSLFYSWSSRILINFVWFCILRGGQAFFAVYMAVCMFVLLRGLYEMIRPNADLTDALLISAVALMFPVYVLNSAGWIATATSYFGPQAFGVWALLPIKRVLAGEKISWIEFVFCTIAAVYSGNAEQMCVVLVFVYAVATIAMFVIKKFNWRLIVLFLFNIGSMVLMLKCPGNWGRSDIELVAHFPTYKTLSIVDKMDIGVSTTLQWLFAGGRLLIIVICVLLVIGVFNKYKMFSYRFLSLIPLCFCLIWGPLSGLLSVCFPHLTSLGAEVDYYGSFNIAAQGSGTGALQFGLFLTLCLVMIICVILINDSALELVTDLTLVLAGMGSRVMIALSPSIYVSGDRTFTTLVVCFMVLAIIIYKKTRTKDILKAERMQYIALVLIAFSFVNLFGLISA